MDFTVPETSPTATIDHEFHVHTGTLGNCNVTIGGDPLTSLGLDISFANDTIKWPRMHVEPPM